MHCEGHVLSFCWVFCFCFLFVLLVLTFSQSLTTWFHFIAAASLLYLIVPSLSGAISLISFSYVCLFPWVGRLEMYTGIAAGSRSQKG